MGNVDGQAVRKYRQKLLAKQAENLVLELQKVRQEENEFQSDGVIRQKVIKRKSTRIAYRTVGIVFVSAGIMCMWWAMDGHYRMVKSVIAMAALIYGLYLIRASFRSGAYDCTYLFGKEVVTVLQRRGSRVIPYDSITGYTMIEPDPEMKYYIIKIDIGRESYIVPFAGAKSKCDEVYNILREKVKSVEEEDTGDTAAK